VAVFKGQKQSFDTAKDGYVWLLEKFMAIRPELFLGPSSDTVYLAIGKSRNYFAKRPHALFRASPHLADNPGNFARLSNGWFANLNLSNDQKFDILCRFSAVTGLEYETDWTWQISGATRQLLEKQRGTRESNQLLKELCAIPGCLESLSPVSPE
jgi:hypothetical protein